MIIKICVLVPPPLLAAVNTHHWQQLPHPLSAIVTHSSRKNINKYICQRNTTILYMAHNYGRIQVRIQCTGSFRKNGKSKTVFMDTKFHKKLIFSAFFSRELATNLRSWATRSITITLWHPENVAPAVWFQALVGWLRLTTASTP